MLDFRPSPLQLLNHPDAKSAGVHWYVKRDDCLSPGGNYLPLQGNKIRKLRGHLLSWHNKGDPELPILSFGGAYSNHLIALAAAGAYLNFPTIGIVRGEVLDNPHLTACRKFGMELHFVSRQRYRQKHLLSEIEQYRQQFGPCFIIPEGGSGPKSHYGTAEILPEIKNILKDKVDFLQVAAGTGGTVAGIIKQNDPPTVVEAFPVLKGGWMVGEIEKQLVWERSNWRVVDGYHFGGYAKRPTELLDFCHDFTVNYGIPLEPIYTGKLFYGVLDRIRSGVYPAGSILVTYHSGGIYY